MDAVYLAKIIDLARHDDLDALMTAFLDIAHAHTSAALAYLELYYESEDGPRAGFRRGIGCTAQAADEIRAEISNGIISHALVTGEVILCESAMADRRFAELSSVRQNEIASVLCVPMGIDFTTGVLYLQGNGAGQFRSDHRDDLARVVPLIARLVERLLRRDLRSPFGLDQAVGLVEREIVERALARNGGNVAATARELKTRRSRVYQIMRNVKTSS